MSVLGLTWNLGSLGLGAAPPSRPGTIAGSGGVFVPPGGIVNPPAGVGSPTSVGASGQYGIPGSGIPPNGFATGYIFGAKATPFPTTLPPPLTLAQLQAQITAFNTSAIVPGSNPVLGQIATKVQITCQSAVNAQALANTFPSAANLAAADRAARLAALAVKCQNDAIVVVSAGFQGARAVTATAAVEALGDIAGGCSLEASFLVQGYVPTPGVPLPVAQYAPAPTWAKPPVIARAIGSIVKSTAKFTIVTAPLQVSGHEAEFQFLVPYASNLSPGPGSPPPPSPGPPPQYLGIIGIIQGIGPPPPAPPLPGPNQYINIIRPQSPQQTQAPQQAQQAQQPGSQSVITSGVAGGNLNLLLQQQMQQIQAQQDTQQMQSRQQYIQQQQAILNQQSILQNQRSFALSQAAQTDLQEDIASMLELIAFGTSESDVQLMLSRMRNGAKIQGLLGLSLGLAGPPSAGFSPSPSSLPPTPR